MRSIPTTYRGRYYRSRLEARWAAFFDALDWPYEYEAVDLGGAYERGYIPDFMLTFDRPLLVECKPFMLPFEAEALDVCRRIDRAWQGDALLVGSNHVITEHETTNPEIVLDADGMLPVQAPTARTLFNAGTIIIGRMRLLGNRAWDDAYLAHEDGVWFATTYPSTLDGATYERARWSWAEAGNQTQ